MYSCRPNWVPCVAAFANSSQRVRWKQPQTCPVASPGQVFIVCVAGLELDKCIYVNNGPSFQIVLLSVFEMVADKNTDTELKNPFIDKAACVHHAVGSAFT